MTAQPGKDLLLKIGDGEDPEQFTTIAGLRSRTISLNTQVIDITSSTSPGGWRELLGGGGIKQAHISGAGVFLSGTVAEAMRTAFFGGTINNFEIIIPGLGTITGPFQIANLDYAGAYDSEASVSIALQSAGTLSFVGAS